MNLATPALCLDPDFPATDTPAPMESQDFDLLVCVRALGGWVEPTGLGPRAEFDRLVEEGALEAWPGRPLYRAVQRSPL